MKFGLPKWLKWLLCFLGIHFKDKWVLGQRQCICGLVTWDN